ncbi:ferric-dicitrate binding protein FerR (iron transport regulator) [Dysgonomonas hofstadii]|uniref:Ferric-dicitrate binding protein FerR (Iron transport regulator) n=1 Tax=Dysgonomonas hofstadii TaxID=637886 RepID=A0A840D081_9BACT|nr:FecR domain-containing protein [Dysgonomonas hofstadii]MBB4037683.1 ferric-dicitrate binding protein FerR (iron transport regulator) [Dysgonomonas hofstadii]
MKASPLDKNILGKYFDGTISDEELTILSGWIEESEENEQEFLAIYRIWNSLEFEKHKEQIDISKELEIFRENIRIENNIPKSNKRRKIIISSVAAACILLSILILNTDWVKLFAPDTSDDIMSFVNTNTNPNFTATKDIQLILSDSKKVELDSENADIQYKDDRITMDDSKDIAKDQSSSFNQLLIPYGKRSTITFSDGTKVWANAGTQLVYPIEFNEKEREIFIDGQIYLDVAKDANRPFIVKTKDMEVKVLGTKFNITAYSKEDNNNVILVSGMVNISNKKTNSKTTLSPNKMYVYDKNSLNENVKEVDTSLYTSWIDGKYIFNKESFEHVLARLSMYYGVTVDCEAAAGKYLCSGKLNLKDDFDIVLDGLANSVPISYTMEEGIYKIKLLK